MHRKRKCRKCRELFLPDPRSYRPTISGRKVSAQHYCSKPACQTESDRQSHRKHSQRNPLYRQNQLLSARRWRKKNGGYWHERRQEFPAGAKRNRVLQRQRDARSKANLANINSIKAVRIEKLKRIDILIDLANINSIEVPWMTVSEEIDAFLRWSSHLANIKAIGNRRNSSAQSSS